MNRDIKEAIIYIALIMINMVLPSLLVKPCIFLIPKDMDDFTGFGIFITVIFLSIIITFFLTITITILAIKKAKGKYLRTFFDSTKYSAIALVLLISSLCLTCNLKYNYAEWHAHVIIWFIYILALCVFSYAMFARNIKKTIIFASLVYTFYLILPLSVNHYYFASSIKMTYYTAIINLILICLTILIYNLCKFIKSKQQKH